MSWREVAGWPAYEVSNDGRVRSRRRRGTAGGELTPWLGGNEDARYLYVTLTDRGRRWDPTVHKLVAEAFLPPAPTEDHQVDHVDGDRWNNRAANLEWVEPSENKARYWALVQAGVEPAEDLDRLEEILHGDLPF